jgi:hypothetical protein
MTDKNINIERNLGMKSGKSSSRVEVFFLLNEVREMVYSVKSGEVLGSIAKSLKKVLNENEKK